MREEPTRGMVLKMKRSLCFLLLCSLLFTSVSCAHSHEWSAWSVTREETCARAGEKTRVCATCSETDTQAVEKSDAHTAVTDAGVPPTCLTTGLSDGSHCAVCGLTLLSQEPLPRLTARECIAGACSICADIADATKDSFDDALPTFYIETDGAKIPSKSDPAYKDYAECEISLQDGETEEFSETAKIRIRGTSSRFFSYIVGIGIEGDP